MAASRLAALLTSLRPTGPRNGRSMELRVCPVAIPRLPSGPGRNTSAPPLLTYDRCHAIKDRHVRRRHWAAVPRLTHHDRSWHPQS
jgi:hypothetical protein